MSEDSLSEYSGGTPGGLCGNYFLVHSLKKALKKLLECPEKFSKISIISWQNDLGKNLRDIFEVDFGEIHEGFTGKNSGEISGRSSLGIP